MNVIIIVLSADRQEFWLYLGNANREYKLIIYNADYEFNFITL